MTTEIDAIPITPHGARAVEEQGGERLTPPPPTHPAIIAAEIRASDTRWPRALAPNAILDHDPDGGDVFWKTVRLWRHGGHTLAGLGRYEGDLDNKPWYIHLYSQEQDSKQGTVHSGFGQTPREAYREAYREQRLAGHDVAELLKEHDALWRQLRAAQDKIALEAARSTETRREVETIKGRLIELQALCRDKPARDPGTAVLTLAYLRAWLTNAPLGEIQREGLEVLLALAQPWHARGRAWQRLLASVQRMGITVGVTPVELEARRGQ